jgi:pantetheine-phosphate adenylyltransferase
MPGRKALYPGSFDPLTLGHLDLIRRGLGIFDEVTVAVVRNPGKSPLFSSDERVALIREATQGMAGLKVESFDGLLVEHVKKMGDPVVLRGLRVLSDFEYEFQMALMNRKLHSAFEVVYLMPDERYTYVSSSLVKEIARLKGHIDELVPPVIAKAIHAKLKTA